MDSFTCEELLNCVVESYSNKSFVVTWELERAWEPLFGDFKGTPSTGTFINKLRKSNMLFTDKRYGDRHVIPRVLPATIWKNFDISPKEETELDWVFREITPHPQNKIKFYILIVRAIEIFSPPNYCVSVMKAVLRLSAREYLVLEMSETSAIQISVSWDPTSEKLDEMWREI